MRTMLRWCGFVFLASVVWCAYLVPALWAEVTGEPVLPEASFGALHHGTLASLDARDGLVPASTPEQATHIHAGVDLVAPCGTPVYPVADGRVVEVISSESDPDFASLGYMVRIRHAAPEDDEPSRRDRLREAQQRLQQAGFDPGPADGLLGPRTTTALRQYQAQQGLPATGEPDPTTLAALGIPDSADGFYSLYLHLQSPPTVAVDERVSGGCTVLGEVGSTGAAQACYTHFEVRRFPGRYLEDRDWHDPHALYGSASQQAIQLLHQHWDDPTAYLGPSEPVAESPSASAETDGAEATMAKLTLLDGRRRVGQIQRGSLDIESAFGASTVEATSVVALDQESTTLRDGSVIKGRPVGGHLTISTPYGSLTLPANQIDTITVPDAGPPVSPGSDTTLSARHGTRQITGRVVDGFGMPVPEAEVAVESTQTKATTDVEGRYTIRAPLGQVRLRLGKARYTPATISLDVPDRTIYSAQPVTLYAIPAEPGIWAFGPDGYIPLQPGQLLHRQRDLESDGTRPTTVHLYQAVGDFTCLKRRPSLRLLDNDGVTNHLFQLGQRNDAIAVRFQYRERPAQYRYRTLDETSRRLDDNVMLREITVPPGKYALASLLPEPQRNPDETDPVTAPVTAPVYLFQVSSAVGPDDPAAPPPPEQARVRIVNDTDQILHVYVDNNQDYIRLQPRQALSKELDAGLHRIKARAVLELGPVLANLGTFDSSVNIREDDVIHITSGALRLLHRDTGDR